MYTNTESLCCTPDIMSIIYKNNTMLYVIILQFLKSVKKDIAKGIHQAKMEGHYTVIQIHTKNQSTSKYNYVRIKDSISRHNFSLFFSLMI